MPISDGTHGSIADADIWDKIRDLLNSQMYYPKRNLLANGDMRIAQRALGVSGVTSSGYYTCDRWKWEATAVGTWQLDQSNVAPTSLGFIKSFKAEVTTAGTPGTTGLIKIEQRIEGQDLQMLKKGTANAEGLALKFWVQSSLTGTHIVELYDMDNTRQISKAYTINAANTFEEKEIIFPPDTTGLFDNDNNESLRLIFYLSAGSNFTSGTLNDDAWAAAVSADRAVGQVNLAGTIGNIFRLTGVRLVIGNKAGDYPHESYADNLRRCQRYFHQEIFNGNAVANKYAGGSGAGYWNATISFPMTMRANPTVVIPTLTTTNCSEGAANINSTTSWTHRVDVSGAGVYRAFSNDPITFDAEL